MLFKNFLGLTIGIMVGIWIATICGDITVFVPNIRQHESLITAGIGILLYLSMDRFHIWQGIFFGIMGILIIHLLGGLTFKAVSCGTIVTVIIYASMGLLKVMLAFHPQHKLE